MRTTLDDKCTGYVLMPADGFRCIVREVSVLYVDGQDTPIGKTSYYLDTRIASDSATKCVVTCRKVRYS